MLCQNELKLSKIMMVDVIERHNFDKQYLYNNNGRNIDEILLPFTSKTMQLIDYVTNVREGVY